MRFALVVREVHLPLVSVLVAVDYHPTMTGPSGNTTPLPFPTLPRPK